MSKLQRILTEEGLLRTSARTYKVRVKTWDGEHVFQLTAAQKEALKIVPGGKDRSWGFNAQRGELSGASWNKRGGHPDRILKKVWDAVKKAGFRKYDRSESGSPDGSYVRSGWTGRNSDGDQIYISSSYGVTARENTFQVTLDFKNPPKLLDPEWEAKRQEEDLKAARKQMAESVLSAVRGLKVDSRRSSPVMAQGILPKSSVPTWTKKKLWGDPSLVINHRQGYARASASVEEGENSGVLGFNSDFPSDDLKAMARAVGQVLDQLKNAQPSDITWY